MYATHAQGGARRAPASAWGDVEERLLGTTGSVPAAGMSTATCSVCGGGVGAPPRTTTGGVTAVAAGKSMTTWSGLRRRRWRRQSARDRQL
jgi:hypothetical protein